MKLNYNIFGAYISAELIGSDDIRNTLEQIIPSAHNASSPTPSVVASKNPNSGHYELSGEGLYQSFTCDDPINAICGITSGIIGRYAQLVKDKLCFHAAAIIFNSKAYLIPSTYRSGKSSFCLNWLQSGESILTDDATILDPDTHHVSAFGLPLCIRNSLLKDAGQEKLLFVESNKICSGKSLTYVKHSNTHRIISYPFGGWIFLSRQKGAEPSVRAVNPSSVIQQIIWQNFARNMPPSAISKIAADLARTYPVLFLHYSEADDVIPALKKKLAEGVRHQEANERSMTLISEIGQADHVSVLMTETGGIVSDDRKGRVYSFNLVALQFWYLMTSHTSLDDAKLILGELYPDTPIDIVLKDFNAFKTKLIDLDLLQSQFVANTGLHPS